MRVVLEKDPARLTAPESARLRAAVMDTPFVDTVAFLIREKNKPTDPETLFAGAKAHKIGTTRAAKRFNNLMLTKHTGIILGRFDLVVPGSPRKVRYAVVRRTFATESPFKKE